MTAVLNANALPARTREQVLVYPNEKIVLHPSHDEFRQVHRKSIDPQWFVYEVCKSRIALPEVKLDYQWHMPACRVDTMDGLGFGWRICDFMFIGPSPILDDVMYQTCLTSGWGRTLREQMKEVGYNGDDCMVTHAMRFPLPSGITSYAQAHKTSNRVYAQADCYACQPRAIITLGADALKVLFGKEAKLDSYRGSVHEWNGIPVIPTCNPAAFSVTTAGIEVFQSELFRAIEVSMHNYVSGCNVMKEGYRICRTAEETEQLEADLVADGAKFLSIDTEFGNSTGREEDNKLRTLQVAWGAGKAALVVLRGPGMTDVHSPEDMLRIKASLVRLLRRPDEVRLEGQHVRVDIEMPHREGIDLDDMLMGAFDTMLARNLLHGACGDESDGLDHIIRSYVPEFGNYWKVVEDWLDTATIPREGLPPLSGRKNLLRFGYAWVPDEVLFLYALLDADATWQAARKIEAELELQPRLKKLYWDVTMPTAVHLMDVERHGIKVDQTRISEIRDVYKPVYEALLQRFRDDTNWPAFNPNSGAQKAAFLFRDAKHRDKKALPEGVIGLNLTPLYNTAKYPVEWDAITAEGEEGKHFPSTKAATIELMWRQMTDKAVTEEEKHDLRLLKNLKHLSVLGKFLSTYLTLQELNEYGFLQDGKNIANNVWRDGRVRGHFHQTSETGRYRCYKPNLQTNPKKQEEAALEVLIDFYFDGMSPKEYKRRTNDDKNPADLIPKDQRIAVKQFKSCYVPEKGFVFIEVDFKTAEICVLAFCSGDETLTRIIEQGRDLHCETACKAFQLPPLAELEGVLQELEMGNPKPYEEWSEKVKKQYEALRTAAKTVVFGLMYGRGAGALAREIGKVTKGVTKEMCQKIIDGFSTLYAKAWAWIQANKASALHNEYVETAFGRRRYFEGISNKSESDKAAAARQASNSPIQGTVADLLAVAGKLLWYYRYKTEIGRKIGYRVILPIHDAFLIECPIEFVEEMKIIIQKAMSDFNIIPGTKKSLGVDITVYPRRWGEKPAEAKKAA